jgi:putative ABC transport system permease protein
VRFADILKFSLAALWQQKVRTALTTLGVIIATFVLVLSLSVGAGVREEIGRQFGKNDRLRKIEVSPNWTSMATAVPKKERAVRGQMNSAKRQRIREALIRRYHQHHSQGPQVPLSRQRVHELAQLDHVESVVPFIRQHGRAIFRGQAEPVLALGARVDEERFRKRLVAGKFFSSADARSVLVNEVLLYLWDVQDDVQVQGVVGQKLRLEYSGDGPAPNLLLALLNPGDHQVSLAEEKVLKKVARQLPSALDRLQLEPGDRKSLRKLLRPTPKASQRRRAHAVAVELTIAGVLRNPDPQAGFNSWNYYDYPMFDNEIVLPLKTAEDLFFRQGSPYLNGFERVTVAVDSEEHVKEVVGRIEAMGLRPFALLEILERVRLNVLLISFATGFVAAVALLVAALGIINTMLMTVLERTHEIGVMKAVGARDGHIQSIFLVEGAAIGLIGGGLGLLLSWIASFPGDAVARSLVEKQAGAPLGESLFIFPLWLALGVPVFAAVVTTLAAVLPAHRAARVSPIAALRHE